LFNRCFSSLRGRSSKQLVRTQNRKFSTYWGGDRWETRGYPLHFQFYKTKYNKLLDMSARRRPIGAFKYRSWSMFTYGILLTWFVTHMSWTLSNQSYYRYNCDAEPIFYWGRLPRETQTTEADTVNTMRAGPGPRIATYYPDYPDWAVQEHQDGMWKYAMMYGYHQRPSHVPFWYEVPEGEEYTPIHG